MIALAQNSSFLPILAFLAVAVVVAVAGFNRNRNREDRVWKLRELASTLNFDEFKPGRDESFAMGWGFLGRLAQGDDRYAYNLLRGKYQDLSLFVFDYHFQTGTDRNKADHDLTFLMLVFKQVFPRLTIGPEGLGARIAAAFGVGDEVNFESAEFSRNFCVRSADRKFAYDVCHAQMIQYLLANRDLRIEIQGPVILLAFDPLLPVGRIEFNLQRLAEIRSLLPAYLFTPTK